MNYQTQQQDQTKRKSLVITITGAANNGSGLIRITTSPNAITTSERVEIKNVTGTVEANGKWTVTRITSTTFDLVGSAFAVAYAGGGTVKKIQ